MKKKKSTKKKAIKKLSKNKKAVAVVKKTKAGRPKKNKQGQVLDIMTGKYRTGRPPVITKAILLKLKEAFSYGCTDEEACAYAEISTTTLYAFAKGNKEFKKCKEVLKDLPTFKAKRTISKQVEKDFSASKWLLQKKLPDEFGDKPDGGIGVQINTLIADKKKKYDI